MAKLVSTKAELDVLRGMCHKDREVSGTVLSGVDEDYFYTPEGKELFDYLRTYITENGETPSFDVVLKDRDLSDDAREYFEKSQDDVQTVTDAKTAVKTLNNYRRTRTLYNLAQNIASSLEGESFKVNELLDYASEELLHARQSKNAESNTTRFGLRNNSAALVKDILFGEHSDDLIPTGYKAFDSVNGGFPRGALVTIGANSGGGKSTMAVDMAAKQAEMGYRVLVVPLEMTEREMTARLMAHVTGLDLVDLIQNQRIEPGLKKKALQKMGKWVKQIKEKGGYIYIYSPEGDVTLDEVLASANTYNPDVVIVDYIGLLAGTDGDNQWQELGKIARQGKVNAKATNRVNIFLCQVSDEGKIKYSRAIGEHCVAGDTLITTSKGVIRIDSLYPNADILSSKPLTDVFVKSDGGYKKATHIHYNGIRSVYKLNLYSGRSIVCTGSHRFRVLDKESLTVGWSDLNHLFVGDYIAIDNTPGAFSEKPDTFNLSYDKTLNDKAWDAQKVTVDKNLSYILGALCGDGHILKDECGFIASDYNIVIRFTECWKAVFGYAPKFKESKTKRGTSIWRFRSQNKHVIDLLRSIEGLNGKSESKHIPYLIMRSSKESVCHFIAGLFDADGSVINSNGYSQVYLSSVCDAQLQYVQLMLSLLGVHSKVSYTHNSLSISRHSISAFKELIPLVCTKRDLIRCCAAIVDSDYVPKIISEKVDYLINRTSYKTRRDTESLKAHLRRGNCADVRIDKVANGTFHCTSFRYSKLKEAINLVKGSLLEVGLNSLLEYSYNRFDRVMSIEFVGEQKVYDLTVEDTHSYMANGIVTHNSNNSWVWVANQETKEKGLIKVNQVKCRQGRAFPFTLKMDYAHMRVHDPDPSEIDKATGNTGKDGKRYNSPAKPPKNLAA